jgi:hypothetical protein
MKAMSIYLESGPLSAHLQFWCHEIVRSSERNVLFERSLAQTLDNVSIAIIIIPWIM